VSVPVWGASAAAALLLAAVDRHGRVARQPAAVARRPRGGARARRPAARSRRHERDAPGPARAARRAARAAAARGRGAVEKNLAEIDRAIAEIHLAFEAHPNNGALQFLLAEAYRREADMLAQLEWWTGAEREPEAHS
jgi:hypothetical protein